MEAKGLKEVKKASKLLVKKEKIDAKIKQLAQEYLKQVGSKTFNEEYFIALANDYAKQNKNK